MVAEYLDWLINFYLPEFFLLLNALDIVPGVSLLGFIIAVTILCVVVGAILMRV